jgi:hypothetical protein
MVCCTRNLTPSHASSAWVKGLTERGFEPSDWAHTGSHFVRASDNDTDPVGTLNDDWGFWDETWIYWYGGYGDEASARDACADYARRL